MILFRVISLGLLLLLLLLPLLLWLSVVRHSEVTGAREGIRKTHVIQKYDYYECPLFLSFFSSLVRTSVYGFIYL